MRSFERCVDAISVALAVLAAVLLLAATVIITWMVVERSLGMQNSWELEISIELMIAAIFLGSPYTLSTGGHVRMDLLDAVLPQSWRSPLALAAKCAGFLACIYLGWKGLGLAVHAYATGERALGVWQPLVWPKYATIPLGMLMTALQYLVQIRREHCARGKAGEQQERRAMQGEPQGSGEA